VQGFNYHIGEYGSFHAQQPDRPVVVTESGSTVSTRGIYANDPERGYVSAYDLNHPTWSNTAEESWAAAAIRSFIAGTFVWTGFDYRGEPTPYEWPCVNSHFGIMDVCGFPKDNFYYYQARWSKQPVLHLLPHWNWPGKEGQIISVWCHTNCERVELFLNGASLGVKVLPRYGHLEWQVPYAPGLLVAKGFQGDRLVTTAERRTTGAPARLALATEKAALRADGEDTAVVRVAVQDMDGLVVPTASSLVRFNLRGPARILGVGNGDPSCHEPDKASQRSVFGGLCQVILQASHESGEIVLEAESEGLEPARLAFLMQNAFTHRQKQPGEQPAGHQAPQGNLDPGG
jgi:beta-galactosidase